MNIICEITDECFGEESVEFNNPYVRYGARGIVQREDGKIAIFNKKNKNEYKLPGGGIENGETPQEAFKREVLEETGCEIKNIQELGVTKELKSHANFKQISYVFKSEVININEKLNLTKKEIKEGGSLVWLTAEDALKKIIGSKDNIKESKYENMYHSKFINYRDTEILKYFLENKSY